MAALTASQRVDAAVLTKVYPTRSHSGAAQGGFNSAMGEDDSVDAHVFDTVKGSDYLGDQDAIDVLCSEGPEVIIELEQMGVLWSRTPDGKIAQRSLGGAGFPRACYAADLSGHVVLHTLYEQALRRGIRFYSEWQLLELLLEGGRVSGVLAYNLARASFEVIRCKVVILATGGYGRVYAKTTNGLANTGDGMAIAYRAGATLSDMEFVQFHPTTLYGTNILISEAARGEGGYLKNADGKRFMNRYAPEKMELAPRDVVSRAIQSEIREGRGIDGDYVYLDLTHLGEALIQERLPQVRDLASTYAGVDPVRAPLPIEPAQHYSMGGVRTDAWGATALPGLLAAGEVANVSVHGANRLGGNSLLETVVFGRRAGRKAAESASVGEWPPLSPEATEKTLGEWEKCFGGAAGSPKDEISPLRRELTELMTKWVGVFRTAEELESAVNGIMRIARRYQDVTAAFNREPYNYGFLEHLELGHLIELSTIIAMGALRREESRGAHFRLDHPRRDDERWLAHTYAEQDSGAPVFRDSSVTITKHKPQERGY
jgi:succinate dehydrogenase / fumarate reductase flavoprotein subunit